MVAAAAATAACPCCYVPLCCCWVLLGAVPHPSHRVPHAHDLAPQLRPDEGPKHQRDTVFDARLQHLGVAGGGAGVDTEEAIHHVAQMVATGGAVYGSGACGLHVGVPNGSRRQQAGDCQERCTFVAIMGGHAAEGLGQCNAVWIATQVGEHGREEGGGQRPGQTVAECTGDTTQQGAALCLDVRSGE
jgi:hypothetical protein